jgi:hypothetical protein
MISGGVILGPWTGWPVVFVLLAIALGVLLARSLGRFDDGGEP